MQRRREELEKVEWKTEGSFVKKKQRRRSVSWKSKQLKQGHGEDLWTVEKLDGNIEDMWSGSVVKGQSIGVEESGKLGRRMKHWRGRKK